MYMQDSEKSIEIVEPVNVSKEVADLTAIMIARLKSGFSSLSTLEQKLLTMLGDPNNIEAKNPYFLLKVCTYFRSSTSAEMASIWDLAVKIMQKDPRGNPKDRANDEILKILEGTTIAQRDAIRSGLTGN